MKAWWQDQTIYQIYPRSFQDTSGDGIGDLEGIRRRLPYLKELGIDAIWLSPIFPSPMRDFGYDVADYCGIDPMFGTMADFDRLLAEAHEHGLKLLLDFVPNHTSSDHPWFQQSRTGRNSPMRDWYIWADPGPEGGPPTNWMSNFGGSAWTCDEPSGQYYYHAFLESQPDLNWRNRDVREAMYDNLRFWLDKGVDGFRVDVIWHLIKDDALRDNPPNPDYRPGDPDIQRYLQVMTTDRPEVHEVVAEMRDVIEEYEHRLLIGEIYLPVERLMSYYGKSGTEGVHLPFNFQLLQAVWEPRRLASMIAEYEAALPPEGWPNWVLSNHDQPRIAARIGEAQARVAAMLLLTLRGTPTLYYGDELGIGRVDVPPDRVQDPWAKREPDASYNRDSSRTPMPWSSEPYAGFSTTEPWLPLNADWRRRNVAVQADSATSLMRLYQELLSLRRAEPALRHGRFRLLEATDDLLAFERGEGTSRLAVILNFSDEPVTTRRPDEFGGAAILFSTCSGSGARASDPVSLRPNEGLILKKP